MLTLIIDKFYFVCYDYVPNMISNTTGTIHIESLPLYHRLCKFFVFVIFVEVKSE